MSVRFQPVRLTFPITQQRRASLKIIMPYHKKDALPFAICQALAEVLLISLAR